METSHHRTERVYLKLLFWAFVALVLLIAICWGGRGLYVRWQERRLVRSAVAAMQRGDNVNASLAARTVLQIKPSSAAAARIMAELGEKSGNRIALDYRHKVVEVEPNSVPDALALARCALQFNETRVAEQALSGIDEQGKQTADYHAVAALLATANKDDARANREWELAVQSAPDNSAYRFQLATLQLRSGDKNRHDEGKATLNELRANPQQSSAATRELLTDGIAHRENGQRLLELARELQAYPDATINDRLIFLDISRQLEDPQSTSYLTELEASVTAKPADLAALLEWMSRKNLNLVALDYIKGIPTDALEKWPVPLAIANVYARLKDWRKLEETTKNSNWRQGEFMRHAYLARALREQDKLVAAEHEWAAATTEASNQSSSTMALMNATADWKWDKEMLELLWSLTKDQETQREAIDALYRHYEKESDTQGLYRVLVRWVELKPDDLNVQNNLAQVSLLLDANVVEARRIAADVYHKVPTNPAYAATYAYSLLTKGDAKGAVTVMDSLGADQLRDPAIGAYYGLCLAALHDEKARDFLTAGQQVSLLPEEKRLIDKALASLDSGRNR